ncbi:MAG: Stk1 family PASTA domain-containing Ser/Thr kinase [Oscillospiraceae bacterium]|nr:Stk1 family PASTA domain-containing Ser/Thr kinase [Oscillospiraceae bacterium]
MDYYVGKILDGRYEIQEVLGVGGMAVVYRAYDNIDDRPVAVKILKEEYLANEEFRRRFKNESKAIAMLSHPNIVKVYDVSYGERLQYIVMEYVEGITLKEYIEQRRVIPWKEAVHFLTQILRALQHAHDRGVVHRDVKPQNVMLLHSGNIKVTDFGIARFTRSETRTMTENAIGSVHYISPEQARGDLTDGKSDIYSVGVVLYEMLTGELPFQSDSTVSVAIMQLQNEPRRPRELNDAIPLGLEQITIRAMQKSPAERYQSAAEMLLDLEEFKRNPLIRFEYNYYTDREPTRYVSPMEYARPARQAKPRQEEEEEYTERRNLLPKMIGIVVGVVFVVAAFVGLLYYFGDVVGRDKVKVDNFIGMSQPEIQNNADFARKYTFEWKSELSARPQGEVSRQVPANGVLQPPGADGKVKVTLYVSQAEAVPVPNVVGLSYAEAEQKLREVGLTPKPGAAEYSKTIEEGKIVRTDPKVGSTLAVNSTVTLYIATPIIKDELVDMPLLIGSTLGVAEELLNSVELKLDKTDVPEMDSNEAAGKVAWQEFDHRSQVPKGTTVKVKISNGAGAKRSVEAIVPLPDTGAAATVSVYLDGLLVKEESITVGASYAVVIEGNKPAALEVRLNGRKAYTATVNFDLNPPSLSNEQTYDARPIVPYVLGLSEERAKTALYDAGYKIVNVDYKSSVIGLIASGIVSEQSPSGNSPADYTDEITITVIE